MAKLTKIACKDFPDSHAADATALRCIYLRSILFNRDELEPAGQAAHKNIAPKSLLVMQSIQFRWNLKFHIILTIFRLSLGISSYLL